MEAGEKRYNYFITKKQKSQSPIFHKKLMVIFAGQDEKNHPPGGLEGVAFFANLLKTISNRIRLPHWRPGKA